MEFVILHWHGVCPYCGKFSCIYMDFDRDDDGTKMQCGYICDSCNWQINDEEFEAMEKKDAQCNNGVCTEEEY